VHRNIQASSGLSQRRKDCWEEKLTVWGGGRSTAEER
jgi:hypothetical protein